MLLLERSDFDIVTDHNECNSVRPWPYDWLWYLTVYSQAAHETDPRSVLTPSFCERVLIHQY